MAEPLEIILPETGIDETIKARLEKARESLTHMIVEKEDGERESPIINVVESIEDCAVDNPDSITSAFYCIYSQFIQETTPKTMAPSLIINLEPNFVHSLNLAFLISISALSSKDCLKNYTQYRNLAGSWEILEYPCYGYDNNWNVVYEQPANTFSYDAREQNIIFAMVYCLCVKHPLNVDGSELKKLLQFIYNSSKEIPQLTDRIFHYQTPLWYKKSKYTTTPTSPPSTTTTPEHSNDTPQAYSYTEEEQKSIAKVLRQEINEYIIEKLKECIELCESQTDYALLEIALYENNYIKQRNGHQAFIKAMIALHLLEDGSVKTDNLRQKFTSLGKSNATSGMYKTWDTNNTDRIKCEKFAEILKA